MIKKEKIKWYIALYATVCILAPGILAAFVKMVSSGESKGATLTFVEIAGDLMYGIHFAIGCIACIVGFILLVIYVGNKAFGDG